MVDVWVPSNDLKVAHNSKMLSITCQEVDHNPPPYGQLVGHNLFSVNWAR